MVINHIGEKDGLIIGTEQCHTNAFALILLIYLVGRTGEYGAMSDTSKYVLITSWVKLGLWFGYTCIGACLTPCLIW